MPVRSIILPEKFVGGNLLTISMITKEAIKRWANSNAFINQANKQYEEEFAFENTKIGTTLKVRLPSEFAV